MPRLSGTLVVLFCAFACLQSCKKTKLAVVLNGTYKNEQKIRFDAPVMYTSGGVISDTAFIRQYLNRINSTVNNSPFNWFCFGTERAVPDSVLELTVSNNTGSLVWAQSPVNPYVNPFMWTLSKKNIEIASSTDAERFLTITDTVREYKDNLRFESLMIKEKLLTYKPVVFFMQPQGLNYTLFYEHPLMPLTAVSDNEVVFPILWTFVASGMISNSYSACLAVDYNTLDPTTLSNLNYRDTVVVQKSSLHLFKNY